MEGKTLPVTHVLRHQHGFMKSIAAVVLVAFVSLYLQPLAIAAQLPAAAPAAKTGPASNEERLARTLEDIEDRLGKYEDRLARNEDASKDRDELKRLRQNLDDLDRQALADFEKIGKHLRDKNLPKVILDRHIEAVNTYKTEMAALKADVDDIEKAPKDEDKKLKARKAKEYLKAKQKKRGPKTKFDPNDLPNKRLEANPKNKPKLKKEEFERAALFSNPSVQLAALGDFTYDQLPGASDPAYLATTTEVVLTDAIKAKAQELGQDPVRIYNWVYSNTEWVPTWGASQNADSALLTQKGNAFDLASLTIALLRASGIPSRYVHGTIQVPVDKFMNWAGGFTDPSSAQDLVSASGVPVAAVTSGGRIIAFRMEHVWVEAALDFQPSRGAVNRSADSWVAIDPSFKQYVEERGYDLFSQLSFDGDQFMMDYIMNGGDKTPYQYYSKKVIDQLNAASPDWTLEGLYGHERVSPLKPPVGGNLRLLAASLPYKVVARGYTAASVPDALRHKVTIGIANDPAYGVDASFTVSLAELGRERLTLSYVPESSADDAVVSDYGSLFAAPAYAVRVKPILRKGGAVVAVGAGVTLGEKQTVVLSFHLPTISVAPVANRITAGSYSAIVVQSTESTLSVPSAVMQKLGKNAELNETGDVQFDELLGQLLHAIGTQWFFNMVYERNFYSTTTQVAYRWLLTEVMATADLQVSYWFGIPRSATPGPFVVDADEDVVAAAPIGGGSARAKHFMLLAGMTGSSWEHLVLEGFFDTPGVSSMKLLRAAVDQGVPIHRINSSNINQVLPLLRLAAEDIADIQNGVAAGREVTVSEAEIQVGSYRGVGLLVLDPDKGDGLYLISGGLAGGAVTAKAIAQWKKETYNKRFVIVLMRSLVLMYASSVIGTPYGWGCKNPYEPVCEDKRAAPDKLGIDCSGLVQYAYHMAGFPYFTGRNAEGQYKVAGQFGCYPPAERINSGDLIFFDRTYDKYEPKQSEMVPRQPPGPEDILTHVGIATRSDLWIAAESKMVGMYTFRPGMDQSKLHGYGSIFSDSCSN